MPTYIRVKDKNNNIILEIEVPEESKVNITRLSRVNDHIIEVENMSGLGALFG